MLRTNFKNSIIKSFYDKFSQNSDTKNYLFIGKVSEWENDNLPPLAENSLQEELNAWKNMLICKKINADDVVFVIRRINWLYGKVYQEYDDTLDLHSDDTPLDFYVLTSENNVYKCIFNNNGAESQYEPYGTGLEEIITQDGYIWKYVYSVRPELIDFLTEEYIPVEFLDELSYTDQRGLQLDVELDSKENKNGSISNIVLIQVGAPYPFAVDYDVVEQDPQIAHLIQLNASEGSTSVKFNSNTNISRVNDIYKDNYVVYIYSGPGSGQVRNITAYDGVSCVATIDSPLTESITTSSYYKILPKVQITGNGTGALAITVLNNLTKQIDHISVLNGGQNYKEAFVEIKTVKTIQLEKSLARVVISPFNGHGSNSLIELGCKDLMLKTKFDKEEIQSFNFYNDYRQIGIIQDITVVGEEEQQQTFTLDIENINSTTSLLLSDDSNGNFTQYLGVLSNKIIKQGSDDSISQARGTFVSFDFDNKTVILKTINGKFMPYPNSTVYPLVIENASGPGLDSVMSDIEITKASPLNYYSDSTFSVGQTILGQTSNSTGQVVSWTPTFFGTDGKLVIKNLRGSFIESYYNNSGVLVNGENIIGFSGVNTTTGITGFSSDKVGVIKNLSRTKVEEGVNTFRATTILTITRPSGTTTLFTNNDFSEDDRIKQLISNAEATVVGWSVSSDGLTGTLILSGVSGTFVQNITSSYRLQKLINGVYTTQDAVISAISLPQVTRYSGKIIYIENIRPVVRGDDQTEEIKIIIGL
jgi:hypothetical protein